MLLSTCLLLCLGSDIKTNEKIDVGFDINDTKAGAYLDCDRFKLYAGGVYDRNESYGYITIKLTFTYKF